MKTKPVIKRKQNKSRSTNWTEVKSMKTVRKRVFLSSLSMNKKLLQTKRRLCMNVRLSLIQWSQKT